ncbi:hypothetical protein AMJ83_11200 [candidate division WOR_3 bacterium SM23_42]|uniref:Uncharacterized protein n=1 Tax=candidate division WOR_3 bacterium SM23_42 TaxID=1703779 RepID=A0A0S8FNM8_UNCW3|nr:MAG: hypothetical protein AMJ83_11200 [candidate division WOR_3 bacterium SM23_42]
MCQICDKHVIVKNKKKHIHDTANILALMSRYAENNYKIIYFSKPTRDKDEKINLLLLKDIRKQDRK